MELENNKRNLADRAFRWIQGLLIWIIGGFISYQFLYVESVLGVIILIFFIWLGGKIMNSKYEDVKCKCGKVSIAPNDLIIIFCPYCKEKIKLIREKDSGRIEIKWKN